MQLISQDHRKVLETGECTACWKKTLIAEPTKHLPEDASKSEKEEHIKKIIEANQITMRITRCISRETMVEQGGHRHPT